MCFRPVAPLKKVKCPKCGTINLPVEVCKNCGAKLPKVKLEEM